jgi:colanic acid/amylovoran biosynthesis glycosyltransferase
LEAMALGTAVIASRVAGIPELVEDGKSGLLFTPSDWDELARWIQRLVRDPDLANELSKNARAKVSSDFDVRRSAAQLREFFSKGRAVQ